jgi:hypothetical protein
MPNKLNHTAIGQYAERFAQTICDDFFSKQNVVEGKQLTSVSPIKQVNMLVIKLFFQKWQGEAYKIKSPFFNYESEEVKNALETMLNTLSRHIFVERVYFQPLLVEAVSDTLMLLLSPFLFYKKEFASYGEVTDLADEFQPITRYIKTHKVLLGKITQRLEQRTDDGTLKTDKAIRLISGIVEENLEYDDPKPILRLFHKIYPLRLPDLVSPNDVPPHQQDPSHVEAETTEPSQQTESTPVQVHVEEETSTIEENPVIDTAPPVIEHEEVEDFSMTTKSEEIESELEISSEPIKEYESMKTLIPLTKKLAFVKVLFQDSNNIFEEAITGIDNAKDYDEARLFIRDNYYRVYEWDNQTDEFLEFFNLLDKKFER